MSYTAPNDEQLRALLSNNPTIAMVGASANRERPSNHVLRVLLGAGFRVIPVTPKDETVVGQKAYASLADIPDHIDIVDVFRRSDATPAIADEAVKVRATTLWLQLGVANEDAAKRAAAGGLNVVMDTCIAQAVRRLGVRGGHTPFTDDADGAAV